MYKRFLNNNDYLSIVTEEALSQLIRGHEERLAQAEEAAEESILEYLRENYEIERVLAVGKNLKEYNPQITYPAGAHFYHDGKIYEAIRLINGLKPPYSTAFWREVFDYIPKEEDVPPYSQRINYAPGDLVRFANKFHICTEYNGPDFDQIRIPGVMAWEQVYAPYWEANLPYEQWDIVLYDGEYYTLVERYALTEDPETGETVDPMDWTENPLDNDCWGAIGMYDPDYTSYEFSDHEYVVMDSLVYRPVMNPNPDELKESYNIKLHDPRHSNIKKHLLRLAIYELHKLISPNNVSSARITDYETSIMWLRDASRMKLNPGLPRRVDKERKPVADFAIATFMRDYDPYQNPWHI